MSETDTESATVKMKTVHTMKSLIDSDGKWKWISLIFAVSTLFFLLMNISLLVIVLRGSHRLSSDSESIIADIEIRNLDDKDDVFSQLTFEEIDLVLKYLYSIESLRLTMPNETKIESSFIHTIELLSPPKKEVMEYLQNNGSKPNRRAKVYIFRGDISPPMIEEYVVGDLPNLSYGRIANVSSRHTRIPHIYRPFSTYEFMGIYKHVIARIGKEARHVLLESYNATTTNCGNQCLRFSMTPISSGYLQEGKRKAWFWFAYDVEFFTLHPVDFQFLVDMTSSQSSDWSIEQIWYANKLFPSLDNFLDEYKCGSINKTRLKFPEEATNLYSSLNTRQPPLSPLQRRAPIQIEPDGRRFSTAGNTVAYMSWKIRHRMSPTNGFQLFDISFDNEMIVYEMSLQEVIVIYSGYTPSARMLHYADGAGLFGTRHRGLLPGTDCPDNAKFIDVHLYSSNENGKRTYENSVCIFEHNNNSPLRRHRAYGRSGAFYGGLLDSVLVIRTIMSVINYDYVIDYIFHQNGIVETKVSLTGYLSTSFYFTEEEHYGGHLQKHIQAGLHNHLFNFKVDLDVKGTDNRFETLDIKPEFKQDPWNSRDHHQSKYEKHTRCTEQDAQYTYNFETPKYLLISNHNKSTEEGLSRSYRIKFSGISKMQLPSDYGFAKSISWSRHQVTVTKRKDEEDTSSSIFAMWDANDPVVNFKNYSEDNENIIDEDLVAWITLGTQHIPHKENMPNTLTAGSQLSFYLIPYNYFDEDPSMRSPDSVRIVPKDPKRPTEGAIVERGSGYKRTVCIPTKSKIDEFLAKNSTFIFT
ncbi:AOC1 [Mytilus coruscus]|uniref:Amine oxidase n=1 Tax=Mytilus coruscus TaxID=42192 RepID=A0A6J8F0W8_MYTCO|nr:AOC1 [Mytilus coruscus]